MDQSISALRTLRPDRDDAIFWFRDDLHQPCPISPMGMTTVQKHHAWGYHVAAQQTQLPPSKGAYVKIYKGRVYLGFALIEDGEEIARRAEKFGQLVEHCKDHWDEFYNAYIDEVKASLDTLAAVDADRLTNAHLLDHLRKAEEINRRNWEIHFILMYPADAIYLEFEQFCKDRGVDEQGFVPMLSGFHSKPAETDDELWRLAKEVRAQGLERAFMDTPVSDVRRSLETHAKGRAWCQSLDQFLAAYGNRINAAHLDVLYQTWREDPTPVLENLRGYFRRMDEGWDLDAQREAIVQQREQAVASFERKLPPGDMPVFRRLLAVAQKVYAYQEDHGFYIDQGSTAALHYALMACGRRLVRLGLLQTAADVIFLNYAELVEIMDDIARSESVGVYHHKALIASLLPERKEQWSEVGTLDAPLTLGNVPEKMTDPIAIKVFGIVDEVLHPKGEKEVKMHLEGFAASKGVAEGPARVVLSFEEFSRVKAGEILVCPYTGTAWTPLFVKIAGVVTDTGGMLTHAAIAAREYGIPAVVGTWNATSSIRDGDIVRMDGGAGVVDIVKRAA
jgi:pyruvate, water dikinase